MVLNCDCVRAVMLYIEENQTYKADRIDGSKPEIYLERILLETMLQEHDLLSRFARDDIRYSVSQSLESGLLKGSVVPNYMTIISDITPKGHEFLAALKNETVWKQVKDSAKKLGGVSLPILIKMGGDALMKYVFPNP